jgi:Dyp-type peroxidase family
MGFKDGISNPDRFNNDVIWIKAQKHDERFKDGTFMVFQKIEHDLEKWRRLSVREQEKWVGRSKATGLLLGTLSSEEDQKLALDCLSSDVYSREIAQAKLQKLLADQRDPEKEIFNESDQISQSINAECPIWSHVRKSNPRGVDGVPKKIIFRRGYLFMDDGQNSRMSSGLLFICFQKDISSGFEYLKRNYLNNKNFPVPLQRRVFTRAELAERHRHARFSKDELKDLGGIERTTLGMDSRVYKEAIHEAEENDAQNTGRDGLAGPSKLGVNPAGEYHATVALGGGYYYVPPIPNKKLEDIAEQFLD